MGFHVCEYCRDATSSGDVILNFGPGHVYQVPDMILHYIEAHRFQPPAEFIDAVLSRPPHEVIRAQTKGLTEDTRVLIGYLTGPYPAGDVTPQFLERLKELMALSRDTWYHVQTRDLSEPS